MKRFAIAAVAAAIIGLGSASTADAQYIVQYNRITPNGGVASGGSIYNLGTYQSFNTYVSPFGSVRQQMYYSDVFGNSFGRSAGFNNFNGFSYNRGFYQPSPYIAPYGGFSYGFYGRRW